MDINIYPGRRGLPHPSPIETTPAKMNLTFLEITSFTNRPLPESP